MSTFMMCGFALAILSTSSSICSLQLTENLGWTKAKTGLLRGKLPLLEVS